MTLQSFVRIFSNHLGIIGDFAFRIEPMLDTTAAWSGRCAVMMTGPEGLSTSIVICSAQTAVINQL